MSPRFRLPHVRPTAFAVPQLIDGSSRSEYKKACRHGQQGSQQDGPQGSQERDRRQPGFRWGSSLLRRVACCCLSVHFCSFTTCSSPVSARGCRKGFCSVSTYLGPTGSWRPYVLIGLVGLPTAYVLHRRSALNLYSMNVVALCWLLVMQSALWGISIYFGTAGPVESEVITLLKGFFFLAPSIMFSASVFTWVVTRSSPLQFGLQDMLLLVSIASASLAVASILRTGKSSPAWLRESLIRTVLVCW